MTPVTIACVWVDGHVPFQVEYVQKLRSMVKRFVDRPFRFVCLTDRPRKVPRRVEPITITLPHGIKGWWSKVQLFNQAHKLTGRVLYLDLDTLIVASLAPIIDYPAPFALIPHAGEFNGQGARAVVKRFNSSVMVWDAGTQPRLFTDWDVMVTKRLWGDQDWIGEQCASATAMPLDWFPRLSEGWPVRTSAKVVLCKTPKNEQAKRSHPGFAEAWC